MRYDCGEGDGGREGEGKVRKVRVKGALGFRPRLLRLGAEAGGD